MANRRAGLIRKADGFCENVVKIDDVDLPDYGDGYELLLRDDVAPGGHWDNNGKIWTPPTAPLPPTDVERIDKAFPKTDLARVIFEALFELTNRVRALEGQPVITRQQLKTWLQEKLPS